MTHKEIEKRIKNLEKWVENFADFHGIDPKLITKDICKQEKPHYEFKVGDRVQFKSWEEMEQEFGLNDDGNICISPCFAHHMKHLCGTYATILRIVGERVTLKDFSTSGNTNWCYIVDMLKPATDEPKFKVGDKVIYEDVFPILDVVCEITKIIDNNHVNMKYIDEDVYRYNVDIEDLELYIEPRWNFTDDEKVILRNLPEEWKWIARSEKGDIYIFNRRPQKQKGYWYPTDNLYTSLHVLDFFNHLFQSVKWEDDGPCEFRKCI